VGTYRRRGIEFDVSGYRYVTEVGSSLAEERGEWERSVRAGAARTLIITLMFGRLHLGRKRTICIIVALVEFRIAGCLDWEIKR